MTVQVLMPSRVNIKKIEKLKDENTNFSQSDNLQYSVITAMNIYKMLSIFITHNMTSHL